MNVTNPLHFVTTGELITAETGFVSGHGTQVSDEKKLVATVSGFVERTNKVISVRPLSARYNGEIGDVIVGRITEIGDKRWKVDIGARQDAVLQLSSVNLPGGVQRRRTYEDSLQMRSFFAENDLISAEVQKVMQDGSIHLHTRNLKYGKLLNGQFVRVPASLIKRSKQHFHQLSMGVDVIIGTSGFIWLQSTRELDPGNDGSEGDAPMATVTGDDSKLLDQGPKEPLTVAQRKLVSHVRNCVMALAKTHIAIYKDTLMDVYLQSVELGLDAKEIVHPQNLEAVTQSARNRVQTRLDS